MILILTPAPSYDTSLNFSKCLILIFLKVKHPFPVLQFVPGQRIWRKPVSRQGADHDNMTVVDVVLLHGLDAQLRAQVQCCNGLDESQSSERH